LEPNHGSIRPRTSRKTWSEGLYRIGKDQEVADLKTRAFGGFLLLLLIMTVPLFVPARTLDYWQAWVFLAVFGTSALAITLYLANKDPKLLERRIHAGPTAESETSQKIIQTITSTAFVAIMVISALDHRFAWSAVHLYAVVSGDLLVAVGFLIVFVVCKENPFASATINVYPEQRVISTGLYAIVRHPMYLGGLALLVGMPLSLGSWWGLLGVILFMPAGIWRILDEERLLAKNLPGYLEYQEMVKYRLLPFVW